MDDDVDAYTIEELEQWKRDAILYAQRCIAARTLDVDGRMKVIFETRHELAKKLALAVARLDRARRTVTTSVVAWRHPNFGDGEAARSRLSATERRDLADAVSSLESLVHDLANIFGEELCSVVEQLREQSHKCERYVAALLANDAARLVAAAASEDEPLYDGPGHEAWMRGLTALIHESGPGVGWDDLRSIASAARLMLEQETRRPSVAAHEWWIARGRMMFSATDREDIFPRTRTTNVYPHYVLARAVKRQHVEIWDPHPWHRERRKVTREEFDRFCSTAARIRYFSGMRKNRATEITQ